jgi:hypothetical protein
MLPHVQGPKRKLHEDQVAACDLVVYVPVHEQFAELFEEGHLSLDPDAALCICLHHFTTWAGYSTSRCGASCAALAGRF